MSETERERCQDCGQIWEGWHVCMNMPATATATPAPPSDGPVDLVDPAFHKVDRSRDCEHGQLARSCVMCDQAAEIERLKRQRDEARVALLLYLKEADCGNSSCQHCANARAALDAGEGDG